MYFLDELMKLRLYKKPFYLPLNMKNKKTGSNTILLTPDINSTKSFFKNSLFVNKYYNSYYIERAVLYYINQENGNLKTDDNADYIRENVDFFEKHDHKLIVKGYNYDINKFKNSINMDYFIAIASKKYKVTLPKEIIINISRTGDVVNCSNGELTMLGYFEFGKKIFDSYPTYCRFCAECYVMKLVNPIIDETLMVSAALYECGRYKILSSLSDWPLSYSVKIVCMGIDNYIHTNSYSSYISEIIKKDNGLFKMKVPAKDAFDTVLFDGFITKPSNIFESYEYNGAIQLSETSMLLMEDSNQNQHIRNILYQDRIKSSKELSSIYKEMKSEFSFIKYCFLDLSMYKSKNLFFDLSGYNYSFVKNNTFKNKRGYDLYTELLRRTINDSRLKNNGYTNDTVVIPVLDWYNICKTPEKPWMITQSINPISCIYYSIYNDDGIIKDIFKNKTVLFIGEKSYFTVDFSNFDKSMLPKLLKNIKNIILNIDIKDDSDPKDSEKAITVDIIDKIENSQNVTIDNIDSDNEAKENIVNKNGDKNKGTDEITKQELVKIVKQTAKNKASVDDTIDALEDEEKIKSILSDIATSPDNGSDISAARASRMLKLQKDFLDSEFNGRTVRDIISTTPQDDVKIEPKKVKVDSVNEEWNNLNYIASVESYNLDDDIVKIFKCFIDKSNPLAVLTLTVEDTSTSEDAIVTYSCNYENQKGKRYSIKVDIPKILDKRYMKLRGNRKTIQPMLFLMPIIKTDEDTAQIVSCYKKIYVSKAGSTTGKSNVYSDKLIKTLTKNKYKNIKIVEGDNTRVCSKYEVPIDYIDISSVFSKIETTQYIFYFNQDELRNKYDIKDEYINGLPVGINKKSKDIIYFNPSEPTFFSYWLFLMIATSIDTESEKFDDDYSASSSSVRYTYSRTSILNTKIPLVVVCAYSIGLEQTMRRAGIQYKLYSNKRPVKNIEYDIIKLKDGWLEYKLTYASSMLMNGLKTCPMNMYNISEINKKSTYIEFLDLFGGRIKSDGLDNFYDCMIDPITEETLKYYKLPTDYIGTLLHANSLLADNKYIRHGKIRSTRRLRRIEQIADFLYKELSNSYGAYSTGIKHGRDVGFSIKQNAVIDAFMRNNTTSDQSILNALGEYEDYNAATPKGSSGMNSERAYSLDKRSFDEDMMGVLSTSTGFAGNVGITRQVTIDADIVGSRGYILNSTNDKSTELNGIKSLCMTEALTPFGTTRDDPMRTAMNFIQTSKHTMRTEKQGPLLITNGADQALPYLISDTFSFKAKHPGKIIEKTDDIMIVEYDNGTKEFVDLEESIMKNSSSGFYVAIKLDSDLNVGSKVKEGEIIAYDKSSFVDSIGATDNIAYSVGPLIKFAIFNTWTGYEDSAIVVQQLSDELASDVIVLAHGSGYIINKDCDIFNLVKKGQPINEGDELFILQNAYDDEDANALLRALKTDNEVLSVGRVSIKSKYTGVIQDVVIKRTVELDELSPTLKKIVKEYEKNIETKKRKLAEFEIRDENHNIQDIGVLPCTGKLKNAQDSISIEIYIKYSDKFKIGDKLIYGAAVKGVDMEVIPEGMEPRSDYRPEEIVGALLSIGSLNARMVTSVQTRGLINKGLIELTRQCKDILGLPTDLNKK